MSAFQRIASLSSVALLTFGSLVGCGQSGPKLATVSGIVKVNGEPTPFVMVEFQPEENGSPSIGYTDGDGRYKLQFSRDRWGAMLGKHVVRLDFDYDPGSEDARPPFKIPAKYNRNSEIRVEVASGSNSHDFEIRLDQEVADKTPRRR